VLEGLLGVFSYHPFRCQACGTRFWRMHRGDLDERRPSATPQVERRDFDRLAIRIPVTITGIRGPFEAVATDLSVRGCALETGAEISATEPLAVTLNVQPTPIHIAGARARYVAGAVVGIEFTSFTPGMHTRLAKYVATLATGRHV
jgi:hypothetical protein